MIYNVLLLLGVVFNVIAQFSLKTGMKQIGVVKLNQSILPLFAQFATNPFFMGGIVFYGLGFLVYSIVLSKIDLSTAYPISSVTAIILILLISVIFLNESMTVTKALGVLLSCVGIILIFQ